MAQQSVAVVQPLAGPFLFSIYEVARIEQPLAEGDGSIVQINVELQTGGWTRTAVHLAVEVVLHVNEHTVWSDL